MLLTGDSEKEVKMICSSWSIDFYVGIEKAKEYVMSGQAEVFNEEVVVFTDCGYNTKNIKKYIKEEVIKRDNNKCVYCHKDGTLTRRKIHILAGGKMHSLANTITCCNECKIEKDKEDSVKFNADSGDLKSQGGKAELKEQKKNEIQSMLNMIKNNKRSKENNKKLSKQSNGKEYVLYCDASVKKNITVLGNVVLRDGVVIYSKVTTIDRRIDNNVAEMLAVQEGVRILNESKIRNVRVCTDNKNVVHGLKKASLKNMGNLIKNILEFKHKLNLEFKWIPRSKNTMADNLTKGKELIVS